LLELFVSLRVLLVARSVTIALAIRYFFNFQYIKSSSYPLINQEDKSKTKRRQEGRRMAATASSLEEWDY
jgi:hypothetical protein